MDAGITGRAAGRPSHFRDVEARGLRGWVRLFLTQASPRIIVTLLLASAVARVAVGGYRAMDLVVVAIVVGLQPFSEWTLHVLLLHFRPRRLGRLTLDPYIARKHREHHVDPAHIGLVFIALPALASLVVGFAGITLLLTRDVHLWCTALVAGYAVLLTYEWVHYLVHTPWAPRTRLYRRVWRAHRLHHFKNEHYWFGITSHLADRLLGTYPVATTVATSPTARNLHGERTLGV